MTIILLTVTAQLELFEILSSHLSTDSTFNRNLFLNPDVFHLLNCKSITVNRETKYPKLKLSKYKLSK